jgi:hypothetical protein
MRGPILILDKDLRIISVNESFYKVFKVESINTEGKFIYETGEGEWNIPALRRLLEDIIPEDTFFKGFEVTRNFPLIGDKTMILSARQIHLKEDNNKEVFPSMIFVSMEDVTEMMLIAETLALHTTKLEEKITKKTQKLEMNIERLEKEIKELKNNKFN